MKPVAGGQLPEQAVLLGGCSGHSDDKTPGPVGTLPDTHRYSGLRENENLSPAARTDRTLGHAFIRLLREEASASSETPTHQDSFEDCLRAKSGKQQLL